MRFRIRIKRRLTAFYSSWEGYVKAAVKFFLAFAVLWGIQAAAGSGVFFGQPAAVVLLAAICSLLPGSGLLLLSALCLEAGFLQHSLPGGLLGGVLLLTALLLYLCFIPGQAFTVICAGLSLGLGVPLCVPVVCGLLAGPGSMAGISLGTLAYYGSMQLLQNDSFTGGFSGEALNRIPEMLRLLCLDQEMLMDAVILSAVCLTVYLIRRLPVRFCWGWGTGAGVLVYTVFRVLEYFWLGRTVSLALLGADILLGAAAGLILQDFCFALDYKKTEYLQFEDDEYYYYVKAVPKLDFSRNERGEDPKAGARRR